MKASDIAIPPQYQVNGSSETPAGQSSQPHSGQVDAGAIATSRSEQVWGGKPWKTNVVELEGEVMCSESQEQLNEGEEIFC